MLLPRGTIGICSSPEDIVLSLTLVSKSRGLMMVSCPTMTPKLRSDENCSGIFMSSMENVRFMDRHGNITLVRCKDLLVVNVPATVV